MTVKQKKARIDPQQSRAGLERTAYVMPPGGYYSQIFSIWNQFAPNKVDQQFIFENQHTQFQHCGRGPSERSVNLFGTTSIDQGGSISPRQDSQDLSQQQQTAQTSNMSHEFTNNCQSIPEIPCVPSLLQQGQIPGLSGLNQFQNIANMIIPGQPANQDLDNFFNQPTVSGSIDPTNDSVPYSQGNISCGGVLGSNAADEQTQGEGFRDSNEWQGKVDLLDDKLDLDEPQLDIPKQPYDDMMYGLLNEQLEYRSRRQSEIMYDNIMEDCGLTDRRQDEDDPANNQDLDQPWNNQQYTTFHEQRDSHEGIKIESNCYSINNENHKAAQRESTDAGTPSVDLHEAIKILLRKRNSVSSGKDGEQSPVDSAMVNRIYVKMEQIIHDELNEGQAPT